MQTKTLIVYFSKGIEKTNIWSLYKIKMKWIDDDCQIYKCRKIVIRQSRMCMIYHNFIYFQKVIITNIMLCHSGILIMPFSNYNLSAHWAISLHQNNILVSIVSILDVDIIDTPQFVLLFLALIFLLSLLNPVLLFNLLKHVSCVVFSFPFTLNL